MKILVIADAVQPTGFSRVAHSIFKYFDPNEYEIHWLGINYRGNPHDYPYKIYPAAIFGSKEPYGFSRVKNFAGIKFDLIFILNDVWIVAKYLEALEETFGKDLAPIVVYTPVDALNHYPDWYSKFNLVTKLVVYNDFSKRVVGGASGREDILVIPHGVDSDLFYRLGDSKQDIRK